MVEYRRFRGINLILLSSFGLFILGCYGSDPVSEQSNQTSLGCPPERCIAIEQANSELGFNILVPEFVPEDFSLERRELLENTAPGAAPPGDTGSGDVLSSPSSVLMEFRFRGSPAIPGITLLETSLEPGDLGALSVRNTDCAEEINSDSGQIFYINGTYTLMVSADESSYMLCRNEGQSGDFHSVVAIRGNVLIEVVAFPEVRITKEEIIEFVKSLRPAETDVQPQ